MHICTKAPSIKADSVPHGINTIAARASADTVSAEVTATEKQMLVNGPVNEELPMQAESARH